MNWAHYPYSPRNFKLCGYQGTCVTSNSHCLLLRCCVYFREVVIPAVLKLYQSLHHSLVRNCYLMLCFVCLGAYVACRSTRFHIPNTVFINFLNKTESLTFSRRNVSVLYKDCAYRAVNTPLRLYKTYLIMLYRIKVHTKH